MIIKSNMSIHLMLQGEQGAPTANIDHSSHIEGTAEEIRIVVGAFSAEIQNMASHVINEGIRGANALDAMIGKVEL